MWPCPLHGGPQVRGGAAELPGHSMKTILVLLLALALGHALERGKAPLVTESHRWFNFLLPLKNRRDSNKQTKLVCVWGWGSVSKDRIKEGQGKVGLSSAVLHSIGKVSSWRTTNNSEKTEQVWQRTLQPQKAEGWEFKA